MPNFNYGAALIELQRRFGGILREIPADHSVGLTSAEVVGRDPERVFLIIVNLSANDVYVAPSGVASATHGIRLEANGGGFTVNVQEDATMPTLEWQGIATGAASAVFSVSVRREALTRE